MNEVTHNLLKLPDIQEGEVVIAKSFYTADLAVGRRVVHNTASQFLPFLHDRNVMLPFIFLEVFQFLNIKILNQKKKKKAEKFLYKSWQIVYDFKMFPTQLEICKWLLRSSLFDIIENPFCASLV